MIKTVGTTDFNDPNFSFASVIGLGSTDYSSSSPVADLVSSNPSTSSTGIDWASILTAGAKAVPSIISTISPLFEEDQTLTAAQQQALNLGTQLQQAQAAALQNQLKGITTTVSTNNNTLLYVAGGVAVLGVIAYLMNRS